MRSYPRKKICAVATELFVGAGEGFGFHAAVSLLEEELHFSFCGFQFFFAGVGEVDAFFEELDGFFEREVSAFELIDDRFQFLE